jgi:signal transduction histidine kinase
MLLVLAVIVVVVAGLALTVLLGRLVTRPVVTLAGEVRRVARGEYEREIASEGPPEVARLASDINAMRQQIVADLGTVRRGRVELEEANRRLEQQAEELTRSNRDLEQFAYVASHDLQEPLRKVASFCQLLQRRYAGQLDERADQYIAFAVDGAQRMQRLINDLLAFSRIGRITSGFADVALDRVAGDAAAQLSWRSDQVDGTVTWSDLPTVRGEEPLLSALFNNLVSNSLKFRHPDRPPRVHISGERVGDEWHIAFADNGIGVEPEYADKIFVIFQRLHPKTEYPGTGIGLAIAKKIIEYHGGRIWLDTAVRQGTVIRFALPAATTEPGPAAQPAPSEPASPAATGEPGLIPAAVDASSTEETAS